MAIRGQPRTNNYWHPEKLLRDDDNNDQDAQDDGDDQDQNDADDQEAS